MRENFEKFVQPFSFMDKKKRADQRGSVISCKVAQLVPGKSETKIHTRCVHVHECVSHHIWGRNVLRDILKLMKKINLMEVVIEGVLISN